MPNMANITVKNAANVDVIYVKKAPASGDRTWATWLADAISAIIGHRPKFRISTRNNAKNTGRHFESMFHFPVVQTINGIPTVTNTIPFSTSGVLPTDVDASVVLDAFTQWGNLHVASLTREVASEGFAPT